jgi:hypothetical protein
LNACKFFSPVTRALSRHVTAKSLFITYNLFFLLYFALHFFFFKDLKVNGNDGGDDNNVELMALVVELLKGEIESVIIHKKI